MSLALWVSPQVALLKRFFQLMRETCPHVMVGLPGWTCFPEILAAMDVTFDDIYIHTFTVFTITINIQFNYSVSFMTFRYYKVDDDLHDLSVGFCSEQWHWPGNEVSFNGDFFDYPFVQNRAKAVAKDSVFVGEAQCWRGLQLGLVRRGTVEAPVDRSYTFTYPKLKTSQS